MTVPGTTITGANLRTRITIPTTGARLSKLIQDAEPALSASVLTVLVLGRLPDGTDRGAFTVADHRPGATAPVADDYTLRSQHVGAGEDYTSPSAGDLDSWYQAAVSTPAVVVLFW